MTADETSEALAVLSRLLGQLGGVLQASTGQPAAALYYAIGDLTANAPALLQDGSLGQALWSAFELAVPAGATLGTMETIRVALNAERPASVRARDLVDLGIRLTLAEEVRILAATQFTSRQDADAALILLNEAFEAAEEYAADSRDPSVFQALVGAHAAAVHDLATRARPLPRLVHFASARIMTSHALANRLYGDAARCDELASENKIIHPAFMPLSGVALSE